MTWYPKPPSDYRPSAGNKTGNNVRWLPDVVAGLALFLVMFLCGVAW